MRVLIITILMGLSFNDSAIVEQELLQAHVSGCNIYTVWYMNEEYKVKKVKGTLHQMIEMGFDANEIVKLSNLK